MTLRRDYEISIWTLQDEFITVLKPSNIENKGKPQDGKITLKTDGTQECSFSIPKFILLDGQKIVNPIWENTTNGTIIKNLRKAKIIFNKGQVLNDESIEKVFEFVIVDTVERHEEDKVFCDIKGEGLAFHELGKIGYKISLSSEEFQSEDYNSFITNEDLPHATIQYWNNKFLEKIPESGVLDSRTWYYDVQMYWGSDSTAREENKVYEDEYVSSWTTSNGKLVANSTEPEKEKERLIDIEESNKYNITQKIAETFGVFCRYEYGYDSSYHIISRKVIYYNNFLNEQLGYLNLNYPYNLSSVKREYEAKDTTTKMYVKPVDSTESESGQLTIIDVAANRSMEDYVMNFDYMLETGGINTQQYAEIETTEYILRVLNLELKQLQEQRIVLENRQNELAANITLTENSITLDKERISEADDLLNALDLKDSEADGSITITTAHPDTAILLSDGDTYHINLTNQGIHPETIHIYQNIDYTVPVSQRLGNEITGGQIVYDEFGNVIGVKNLLKSAGNNSTSVYITYKYTPKLYCDAVKQTWSARLAKDIDALEQYTDELEDVNEDLEDVIDDINEKLEDKQSVIEDFERMMGPALRESYWQPDDYKDCGDKHIDEFNSAGANNSSYSNFIWDDTLFDTEETGNYKLGINETICYYPCIDLSSVLSSIKDDLDNLSFVFYDYNKTTLADENNKLRILTVGSTAQLGFAKTVNGSTTTITPILILTGAKSMTDESLQRLVTNSPRIGVITTSISGSTVTTSLSPDISVSSKFFNLISSTSNNVTTYSFGAITLVYPRIEINTLALKTGDTDLSIMRGSAELKRYVDYSILTRDSSYYLTINPKALLCTGSITPTLSIYFIISNADIAIYLDALQVLQENAFPKVSYDVTPNIFHEEFIYLAYNQLNRIVNINDSDLQLRNVQGYISQLDLDLDAPWQDKVEVKNYKNKFEDLFSTIVAQTEAMKGNSYALERAIGAFTPNGALAASVIQQSINRADLNYAFNQGTLTIDEKEGIWATSDDGVVAIRGGGIFTATEQDATGNWRWNTGILPQGINADLITTGQLDTNLVRVFAGDKLRFQLNGDGLFAYKSVLDDDIILNLVGQQATSSEIREALEATNSLDLKQYVVHNENGLFLVAEEGAIIPNGTTSAQELDTDVTRVSISWDGLTLRNWNNDKVFYADADTGDLTVKGTIKATSLFIGEGVNEQTIDTYITSLEPKLLTLTGSNIFKKTNNGYTPSTITFTANAQNCNVDHWEVGGTTVSSTSNTYTLSAPTSQNVWTNKQVKVVGNNGESDFITVYVVEDGENGENAYTVFLDNENHTFAGGTSAAVGGAITIEAFAYKGTSEISTVAFDMQNISSNPVTGMTVMAYSGTNNKKLLITVDTTFTTLQGTLSLPIIVTDGSTTLNITKTFSYSLALKGADGAAGSTNFYQSTTPTPTQQGDIWHNTNNGNVYMASGTTSSSWVKINTKIDGTKFSVDTTNGTITMTANNNVSVSGGKLEFTGNSGINIGSGTDINVAAGGTFTTTAQNFNIDSDGNVSMAGNLTATSFIIGESAQGNFNDAITNSGVYTGIIEPNLLNTNQKNVLQTMTFDSTNGLVIRAAESSPYSTATKNDGFYIRYNDTEVAKFTGTETILNSLSIGKIIVKKTSRGGWLWVSRS